MSHHDLLHRYLFEDYQVRGELVQVSNSFQAIINNHNYPAAIEKLVGELFVATSLLTATIKFKGNITVQLQGDGPVHLAAINGNDQQEIRGVARYNSEPKADATLKEMIGKGHMVITITPDEGERYQGVVDLSGDTVAECLENYFDQSEQLSTRIILKTGQQENGAVAGGILLQKLPSAEANHEEDFIHVATLAKTIKAEELFNLDAETVLYRLFNQEKVRLYEPQAISFNCGCSRERCVQALITVEKRELLKIIEEKGQIDMNCEYCRTPYHFDAIDIESIFNEGPTETQQSTH